MEQHKEYYPIDFDKTGSGFVIKNNGTAPAPVIFTIIPKVDFVKLTVAGLTEVPFSFNHLKANDVLVIDGESRTITVNDKNKISDFDGWEFPRILPGDNYVKIENGTSASISIEYSVNYI